MSSGAPPSGNDVLARRLSLLTLPTPVERLDRLGEWLGKPPGTLWVKRDDVLSASGGGNKARKLEYALVEAVENGADHVVTAAGVQSNAARLTAGVARKLGMTCSILAVGEQPAHYTGNLLLDEILGAELVWIDTDDPRDETQVLADEADRQRGKGRVPHCLPIGVSTPTGALGYVRAAREVQAQLPHFDVVVTATGSAGTQAGLAAGFGNHGHVLGIRIGTRRALRDRIKSLSDGAAALAGLPAIEGEVWLDERHVGAGYAEHTDAAGEAIVMAARLEGLLLDPVYTGKAMAGLVNACREGMLAPDAVVVFLHTGGLPGVFADEHHEWLLDQARRW